ncbi:Na+/H+ antiporter subunit E [Lamprobacter modestohalophilus]|uniref:Na+/H+ antiporter subunit E n=1 Tax=Lamprobacter modestohalophilus TaxID=1064514 RepID=UPI002ADECB59|nr:Na+/H+ antiporter subunit E [Lamprobacter modestohalophilus]MEA1051545.1 Na+/H+ antiporter subunit E [Lamprobacter modestohalophilus]
MSRHLAWLRPIRIFLTLAALWLVIAGPELSSWIIGVPALLFATWSTMTLTGDSHAANRPPHRPRLRLGGLLRFLPFFAIESVRGGLDVASRVMRPRLRIDPGFQSYQMQLTDPIARVVFLDSISLLPGTLSADIVNDQVKVHALDASQDLAPSLQRLERVIAHLFGEPEPGKLTAS